LRAKPDNAVASNNLIAELLLLSCHSISAGYVQA
jgi:hypothetical protein